MPIDIIDTATNEIRVYPALTMKDITYALDFVNKERERSRNRIRHYEPTGKPRGRPKKTPAEDPK